jgi:hypothetical protein
MSQDRYKAVAIAARDFVNALKSTGLNHRKLDALQAELMKVEPIVDAFELPRRPFNVSMVEDAMLLEKLLDALEVSTLEVSMPRSWGEGSSIDHCYIKLHTATGSVQLKRKSFAAALLAVVAGIETLQSLDGNSEERRG